MRGSDRALGGVAHKLGVQLHHEGGRPQPRGGLIDSLMRPIHRSTSVGLLSSEMQILPAEVRDSPREVRSVPGSVPGWNRSSLDRARNAASVESARGLTYSGLPSRSAFQSTIS